MNDLDFVHCLAFCQVHSIKRIWWWWWWPSFRGRIKVMSTIALHSALNISETVRDRGLFPKDHQQKMAYGLWSRDRWRHVTLKGQTRDRTVGYPTCSDSLASCYPRDAMLSILPSVRTIHGNLRHEQIPIFTFVFSTLFCYCGWSRIVQLI